MRLFGWIIFFESEDKTLDEIIKDAQPYKSTYIGYLVHENKDIIVLCSNVWEDGGLSCPMYIIKNDIVSRSDKK